MSFLTINQLTINSQKKTDESKQQNIDSPFIHQNMMKLTKFIEKKGFTECQVSLIWVPFECHLSVCVSYEFEQK
jgi:hypothetical protein